MSEFWECSFLVDSAAELKKHEALTNKNEKVLLKKFELLYLAVLNVLDSSKPTKKQLAECIAASRKLKREEAIVHSKAVKLEDICIGLKEECTTLKMQVTEKQNNVPIVAQELDVMKLQVRDFNKDLKEARKKHEENYRSLLLVKDAYKKNLGCHLRLQKSEENGYVFIFSFDTTVQHADSKTMPPKSVKLCLTPKEKHWKLLDTNPHLPQIHQLIEKFEESQDTQGLLVYLKSAFKKIR